MDAASTAGQALHGNRSGTPPGDLNIMITDSMSSSYKLYTVICIIIIVAGGLGGAPESALGARDSSLQSRCRRRGFALFRGQPPDARAVELRELAQASRRDSYEVRWPDVPSVQTRWRTHARVILSFQQPTFQKLTNIFNDFPIPISSVFFVSCEFLKCRLLK